ncbi:MAG: SDR family oxidoreductase [Bacillota bacterium]
MEIKDKVVIITGSSSGIGLSTARLFSRHGAKLAIAARSEDKLKELANELKGDIIIIPTDMRDEAAVKNMIAKAYEHFGRIDVLINNAGQGMHVPVEYTNLKDYRSVFELNVVSVILAMQEVIPIMRKQGGGVIVNISSGLTKRIIPTVGPYASTKYALNAITLTARMELEKDNIKVGLVIPGITATDFFKNTIRIKGKEGDPALKNYMSGDSPDHVAEKILEAVQTGEAEVYADSVKQRQ